MSRKNLYFTHFLLRFLKPILTSNYSMSALKIKEKSPSAMPVVLTSIRNSNKSKYGTTKNMIIRKLNKVTVVFEHTYFISDTFIP